MLEKSKLMILGLVILFSVFIGIRAVFLDEIIAVKAIKDQRCVINIKIVEKTLIIDNEGFGSKFIAVAENSEGESVKATGRVNWPFAFKGTAEIEQRFIDYKKFFFETMLLYTFAPSCLY